jgi:tRNA(Ile)-lysidine synthase
VRPFLDLPRARLLEEAAQRRLTWREDATNRNLDPWRNRVRHELLPLLRRRFHPAIGTVLHRTMDLLRAESVLGNWAAAWWLRKRPKPEFQRLPLAVQRRSIRQQLIVLGIPPDFGLVERLRHHVGTPWTIAPDRGLLLNPCGRVAWVESDRAGFQNQRQWLDLTPRAGRVLFAGRTIHWSRRKVERRTNWRAHGGPGREVFDAARVGETIVLRHWQPGDRLQPIGFPKPAKLQDLFVANKVPRSERRRRLVAETAAGEIFWVEGLRISDRFKVQTGSRQLLLWRWL